MAEFRKISEDFLAAPQLAPEDFARAASDGVRLVINNRVEGEAPGQMTDEEARTLAGQAGLAYAHIPVRMSALGMADVEATQAALASAGGPALGYCLSGTRSAVMWALARAREGQNVDGLIDAAASAGFDLEALRPALQSVSPRE